MDFEFSPELLGHDVTGAASDKEDPRLEAIQDLEDKVSDDFDYVLAGIDRLIREGMLDDASSLLSTLSETLDSAVSIIGNDFDKAEE